MPDEEKVDATKPEIISPFAKALENYDDFEKKAAELSGQKPAPTPDPPKEPEQKEPEQKPDTPDPDAADLQAMLAIDPADLKTKAGIPISDKSRASFATLQAALKRKHEQLEQLRAEKVKQAEQTLQPKFEETEEYKALTSERDKFKKEVDLFAFENSEEWQSTFEKPIKAQHDRLNTIVSGIELDEDDTKEAQGLMHSASLLLGDMKNEIKFSQIVDKISEDYVKGTAGRKFTDSMLELFTLTAKRADAKADREKAVTEIRAKQTQQVNGSFKSLQDRADMELLAFERTPTGEIFKKADYDFEASSKANREKALQAIKDFQISGQVTQEMGTMVREYMLLPSKEKERNFFIDANIKLSTAVEKLLKENKEMTRRILELRGEGGSDAPEPKPKPKDPKTWDARNVFGNIEERLERLSNAG